MTRFAGPIITLLILGIPLLTNGQNDVTFGSKVEGEIRLVAMGENAVRDCFG